MASATSAVPNNGAPSFARDIAPILSGNCARCHSKEGSAAGIPLLTYEDVKARASDIRTLVQRREMPPWPVDASQSLPLRNDPRLRQRDIDTVTRWVEAGAPKGSDGERAPMQAMAGGWLHPGGRAPDVVVTLPTITVRANGAVPYIRQLIKIPYTEDKWISALQVRAGNSRLMHHMGITEVSLPDGMAPEQLRDLDTVAATIGAPSGGLQVEKVVVPDRTIPGNYDMLGVYTPGTTFESYGAGNGKLLKGGSNVYLNFNIHYTTTGRVETDRSQLALWFEPTPPKHVLYRAPAAVNSIIANGRELLSDDPGTKAEGTPYALPPIPANTAGYELIGMTAYQAPVTIYQLQPHAHVRATDFRYVVVYPDGHTQSILSVPNYSYHFQLAYALATPLELPAGSKLIVTAHYDNSSKNTQLRHLGDNEAARRCGPENVAYFGQQNQSWDEMFSPLIQYSVADTPRQTLGIVKTVGCLVHDHARGWLLTHGSKALSTSQQGTSSDEVNAAGHIPFGDSRYQLLGVDVFQPSKRSGQKVAIKGVLIPATGEPRINVTSLQATSTSCTN